MGLLGSLGRIILGGALGGPGGAVSIFTVDHGDDVLEGTIDIASQIVEIGEDIYRAIPPEAFFLAGDPIHGLLKHEFENEIILIGRIGVDVGIFTGLTWPLLGPIGMTADILKGLLPTFVNAGLLDGLLDHRLLNDQEWEMAQYIFHDTLFDRSDIILTDIGGIDGRPFVLPTGVGEQALVNLGNKYTHDVTIPNGPALFHELTHVWQAKRKHLTEIFVYGAHVQITEDRPYDFAPGAQWNQYNLEQQASIVEAWALGSTQKANELFDAPTKGKLSIGSPMFHHINRNIRRADTEGSSGDGRSARQLLGEGGHRRMNQMHSRPPTIWW